VKRIGETRTKHKQRVIAAPPVDPSSLTVDDYPNLQQGREQTGGNGRGLACQSKHHSVEHHDGAWRGTAGRRPMLMPRRRNAAPSAALPLAHVGCYTCSCRSRPAVPEAYSRARHRFDVLARTTSSSFVPRPGGECVLLRENGQHQVPEMACQSAKIGVRSKAVNRPRVTTFTSAKYPDHARSYPRCRRRPVPEPDRDTIIWPQPRRLGRRGCEPPLDIQRSTQLQSALRQRVPPSTTYRLAGLSLRTARLCFLTTPVFSLIS